MLKIIKNIFKSSNQSDGLTKREIKTVLKIAAKSGGDWDGDILRIYVNESERSVEVLKP